MIRFLGTEERLLTPELATDFATMPEWKCERPLNSERMEFLKQRLLGGLFYSPRWATARLPSGCVVRVNGKTSSTMLAEANGYFPERLNVLIDRFSVDNDRDMAELFQQFDNKASARNARDTIRSHARIYDAISDVSDRELSQALGGIASAKRKDYSGASSRVEESAALVHDNIPFLLFYSQMKPQNMGRRVVAAAVYQTWKVCPAAARDFWINVFGGDDVSKQPVQRLREYLLTECRGQNRSAGDHSRCVYAKCIHAWNAFRQGRRTDLKYHDNSPVPVPV